MYVYIYITMHIYIYIERERERDTVNSKQILLGQSLNALEVLEMNAKLHLNPIPIALYSQIL